LAVACRIESEVEVPAPIDHADRQIEAAPELVAVGRAAVDLVARPHRRRDRSVASATGRYTPRPAQRAARVKAGESTFAPLVAAL
jgi:hypothetical protein